MKITDLIILGIVISMFSIGILSYVNSVDQTYKLNFTITDDFDEGYDHLDEYTSNISLSKDLFLGSVESDEDGSLTSFIRNAYSSVKQFAKTPFVMIGVIDSSFDIANPVTRLDPAFKTGLILIIVVLVVVGVIYAILKVKP